MAGECLTTWLRENCFAGKVVVRVGRCGNDLVAEFVNVGQLTMSPTGANVSFNPVAGVDSAWFEKVRASLVDAFVRHAQGKLTLHGGAVSLGADAIAFVGPSRAGKSTLAAALCADADVGLVADDTVALELPEVSRPASWVEVVPTQKAAWLLPEARRALGVNGIDSNGKRPVPLRGGTGNRWRLAAVVGLVFDGGIKAPKVERLQGHKAFSTILGSVIRFVMDDAAVQLREFDQLKVLTETCSVYELRRPRDLAQLDRAVHYIRELLAGTDPSDG